MALWPSTRSLAVSLPIAMIRSLRYCKTLTGMCRSLGFHQKMVKFMTTTEEEGLATHTVKMAINKFFTLSLQMQCAKFKKMPAKRQG